MLPKYCWEVCYYISLWPDDILPGGQLRKEKKINSPTCHCKPVWLTFICETQKKTLNNVSVWFCHTTKVNGLCCLDPFDFDCINKMTHSSKHLILCSAEERKSYRFGIAWRWVHDRIVFPLNWMRGPNIINIVTKTSQGVPNTVPSLPQFPIMQHCAQPGHIVARKQESVKSRPSSKLLCSSEVNTH